MPQLRGVLHCAGVLDDGTLEQQEPARFRTVMAPKIQGAWNLHMLTRDEPLDFFVLYSSMAGLLGCRARATTRRRTRPWMHWRTTGASRACRR